MGLFQALMPKEGRFFELYNRHAQTLVAGAAALADMVEGGGAVAPAAARIIAHENEADEITREGLDSVRRTFITPFDRIDIKELFNTLDDAIDQMQKTAKIIILFEVTSFEPGVRELAKVIVQAAGLTAEIVKLLPAMSKNQHRIHELAQQIDGLESEADALYDAGRKALFQANAKKGGDAMAFIVGVEIYSHLEKVVDRFEDVANRISGIVIEQV